MQPCRSDDVQQQVVRQRDFVGDGHQHPTTKPRLPSFPPRSPGMAAALADAPPPEYDDGDMGLDDDDLDGEFALGAPLLTNKQKQQKQQPASASSPSTGLLGWRVAAPCCPLECCAPPHALSMCVRALRHARSTPCPRLRRCADGFRLSLFVTLGCSACENRAPNLTATTQRNPCKPFQLALREHHSHCHAAVAAHTHTFARSHTDTPHLGNQILLFFSLALSRSSPSPLIPRSKPTPTLSAAKQRLYSAGACCVLIHLLRAPISRIRQSVAASKRFLALHSTLSAILLPASRRPCPRQPAALRSRHVFLGRLWANVRHPAGKRRTAAKTGLERRPDRAVARSACRCSPSGPDCRQWRLLSRRLVCSRVIPPRLACPLASQVRLLHLHNLGCC